MKNLFSARKRMKMKPSETSVVVLSDSDSESADTQVHSIDESANSEIEVITLDDSSQSSANQSIVTFQVDATPDFIPINTNVLYNKPKRGAKRRFDASPDICVMKVRKQSKQPIDTFSSDQTECASKKSKVTRKFNKKVSPEIQPQCDENSENDTKKPRIPPIQLSHTNIHCTVNTPHLAGGLRPIIIDGCNVAFAFGNGKFQIEGIICVIEYFKKRSHKEIVSFLPQCYRNKLRPDDIDKQIKEYEKENIITYTPSRKLNGKLIKPYDDRFIVQYASEREGVIISNDGYLDLIDEESSWRTTIEQRIINFTFARGLLMLPKDPLGPSGPTLDEMLRFPST